MAIDLSIGEGEIALFFLVNQHSVISIAALQ
jgi:hypothetical protein